MRRFRWSCLFLALALVFAMSSVCFAAEFNFSTQKKDVDSNSYSYIGSAKKDSTTDYAELKLTKIYKANGDDSSYSYVYAKELCVHLAYAILTCIVCNYRNPFQVELARLWDIPNFQYSGSQTM